MQLKRATLNGGAGMVVHLIDMDQPRCRAFPKLEALCGKLPGGGTTKMGAKRSRWRQVGVCPTDSPTINCDKCRKRLAELGVDEATV
jgi:hypothetical protein